MNNTTAIEFLQGKGILKPGFTKFIISFDGGRAEVNVPDLLEEYRDLNKKKLKIKIFKHRSEESVMKQVNEWLVKENPIIKKFTVCGIQEYLVVTILYDISNTVLKGE